MIVPSIDLRGGKAVQLRQGTQLVLKRDDVFDLAVTFGRIGEIAVIDLDAAFGEGSNLELILQLCRIARCRVGGGIRDVSHARRLLRAGAASVIIGTAATPEFLRQLPRERVIVALDERDGCVAVDGWRASSDESAAERARRLAPYCGGFLATQIEREGMLAGIDIARARRLRDTVTDRLTVAGGICTIDQIVALDRLGIDAQVGMALYTGAIDPVDAFVATIDFTKGLVPTIVCDRQDRGVRMVAYSSAESLTIALRTGTGTYWSRRRNTIWRKGETSGAVQRLAYAEADCDRDALIFYVEQAGATCHTGARRCFASNEFSWSTLVERIANRAPRVASNEHSYTRSLLNDPTLLQSKLLEESIEVGLAQSHDEVAWESADLLYFLSVRMHAAGVRIDDVMAQLAARAT